MLEIEWIAKSSMTLYTETDDARDIGTSLNDLSLVAVIIVSAFNMVSGVMNWTYLGLASTPNRIP